MKNSIKFLIIIAFVLIIAIAVSFNFSENKESAENQITSANTIEEALKEANESNKKVLLVFSQEFCSPCTQFKVSTLSNPEVEDYLNENYITTFVDINDNPEIARDYNIFATPITLVLDSNGNEINRIQGYVGVDTFLNEIG